MKENNNVCSFVGTQSNSQVSSGTFFDILQGIREQIEIECFNADDRRQAEEIAMIIAEIFKLPSNAEIQISGNKLSVAMVREIYSLLQNEHVAQVIDNYKKLDYIVNYKKTYIRTALYNEVFEHESRFINCFNTNFPNFFQEKRRALS